MPVADKKASWFEIVENVEKIVFYASLLIIPITIFPLPWDLTEYSMGLSLAFFASIILVIELVKLVWKGRILVPKGAMDIGVLAITISMILSTIFSISLSTSLFGFDFRLGSGAIVFITALAYLYSVRSFLFNPEEVLNGAKFLIVGTFITAAISIVSFYGMNLLAFAPSFKYLFTTGLPILSSSRVSIVVWGVSLILSVFFAGYSFDQKKLPFSFFAMLSFIVHLFAISIFSFAQGWEIFLLVTVLLVASSIWILVKQKSKVNKAFKIILIVLTSIALAFFVITRIGVVRNVLGGGSNQLITQLAISSQTSLKISMQALSQSVLTSIFGVGQDTFSISYNQYRPLDDQLIIINSTNFTNSNNQIFNTITNRGLVGVIAWLVLGFIIFKTVWVNIKKSDLHKDTDLTLFLFDTILILLYVSSIFVYMPFLLTFLMLYAICMSISLRNMKNKENLEVYVINWGIFSHSTLDQATRNMALGVSTVFVVLGVFSLVYVGRLFGSAMYTIKAETVSAQGREKQSEEKLTEKEKEDMLVSAANSYAKAISLNPSNDVIHRRASLVVAQYIDVLAKRYNDTDVEQDKKNLIDQIATYTEIAVEESKKSTEIAPKVYANWGARGSVYSRLVGLGLNSYTKSALSALQTSSQLNPLNFEVYYNAAQLYILNNEADTSLRTLNQLFSINPNHIPSLVLAGEISLKDKDMKQAERYFSDAKRVMENTKNTTNDIYDYVTKKLKEISSGTTTTPTTTPTTTETTTDTTTTQ